MKKILSLTIMLLILIGLLSGCGCEHEWTAATCTAPKTCSLCQETEGEPLTHSFSDATCAQPSTCSLCGETKGDALPHSFADATCTAPKTCTVCNATEGEALPHTLSEANYQQAPVCSVCGETVGEPLTAGFVSLGIEPNFINDLSEPFVINADNNEFTFSVNPIEVFEGDDEHEAADGYLWHTFETSAWSRNDEYTTSVHPIYSDFIDFYDPVGLNDSIEYIEDNTAQLTLAFRVNHLGTDYSDCRIRMESSSLWSNNQWVYFERISIRIPEGYDGFILTCGSAAVMGDDYDANWKDFYNDENTACYRVQ